MLSVHVASTWMLVGLIWTIQIVAYPQFRRVGGAEFIQYHFAHCWRIGLLIAPLLAVETASAAVLFNLGHRERSFLISVGLIFLNWLCTVFVQAPMHVKLMKGFDAAVIRRLILSNWLRTLFWTARGVLVSGLVAI
ncbi:MAG: hypothetical protein ABJF10_04340 [Chthoniobacter sp.]|uniref:hypothetical protein n=1 Tax=Chthoniobacter sp. TaxID=2510640 RepID=UPI0032AD4441